MESAAAAIIAAEEATATWPASTSVACAAADCKFTVASAAAGKFTVASAAVDPSNESGAALERLPQPRPRSHDFWRGTFILGLAGFSWTGKTGFTAAGAGAGGGGAGGSGDGGNGAVGGGAAGTIGTAPFRGLVGAEPLALR
jgi:hypothetical protein